MPPPDPCATTRNLRNLRLGNGTLGSLKQDQSKMTHLVRNVNYTLCSGWRCAPSAEVLHRYLDHARLGVGAYLARRRFMGRSKRKKNGFYEDFF